MEKKRYNLIFLLQNLKGFVNLQMIAVRGPMFVANNYVNVLTDTDRMQKTKHVWVVCIL